MKIFSAFFFLILICVSSYAQVEFSNKSFSIPPSIKDDGKKISAPATPKKNPFSNPAPVSPTKKIENLNPLSMTKKNQFVNPGESIVEDLNKKIAIGEGDPNIDYGAYRKDEYFGDFVTKGEFITINLRDNQMVDGDMLSLYVNGKLEAPQIMLESNLQKFIINLQMGFNTIEFVTLNEGLYYPNTTQYLVIDYQDVLKKNVVFSQAKGFKAKLIVIREK
ncbi:hypothetical protein [Flavobacterium sp.]|uniref:hypothetical protein n=1 Tax=Flavobacterium sp. TaxID=239 RepID=UPI0037BE940C